MKKVINGKMYDTETAQLMGEWDNGLYGNDFGRCEEALYRKKTGEYFLYGYGGPLSAYAVSYGNETSGGEAIKPLTYKEAQEWAEENLDGDEYVKIFGEPNEDDSKEALHIYISKFAITKAKQEAGKAGISVSDYIENLITG